MNGHIRMVEFLLRRGAKLTLSDDPAWATPLAWARKRGHQQIVELLSDYERTAKLPTRTIEEYETLARDLVEAYGSGEERAFQRVIQYFRAERALTWDRPPLDVRIARLRRSVHEHLDNATADHRVNEALELAEARRLVALSEGFASWAEIAKKSCRPADG